MAVVSATWWRDSADGDYLEVAIDDRRLLFSHGDADREIRVIEMIRADPARGDTSVLAYLERMPRHIDDQRIRLPTPRRAIPTSSPTGQIAGEVTPRVVAPLPEQTAEVPPKQKRGKKSPV